MLHYLTTGERKTLWQITLRLHVGEITKWGAQPRENNVITSAIPIHFFFFCYAFQLSSVTVQGS